MNLIETKTCPTPMKKEPVLFKINMPLVFHLVGDDPHLQALMLFFSKGSVDLKLYFHFWHWFSSISHISSHAVYFLLLALLKGACLQFSIFSAFVPLFNVLLIFFHL